MNARNLRMNYLKKLLEENPADTFSTYALALEYVGMEELVEAENIFCSLIQNTPDYTPTYYQLAKLYEHTNRKELAIMTYEKGIQVTQKANEKHALAELRSALNELLFDE